MNDHGKKVYTMEDNIKYISFGIKDIVKQLEKINLTFQKFLQKKDDEKDMPF
jgi:hypothetical protein